MCFIKFKLIINSLKKDKNAKDCGIKKPKNEGSINWCTNVLLNELINLIRILATFDL
jgi:hypothetical protein